MHIKTKNMILVALFTTLTAVGAFIKIPVGPVPITLQIFFTALSGILLGPYLGAMSQLIYIVLGLIGIPIFTAGSGPSYILNPGFGYLIGFIFAPIVIGKIFNSTIKKSFFHTFFACIIGILVIYAIGVPYMYMILRYVTHTNMTFSSLLVIGFIVFIPGDIIKCIIVSLLAERIAPILQNRQL